MLYYNLKNNYKKDTLVVLHGFGGNNNCFKKQFDIFDKFFNVLYIDLHSHGKSKENRLYNKKEVSFKVLSKDIKEILDFLNITQAYFIGLSLGTMIIHSFSIEYPKTIKGIILIGPVVGFNLIARVLLFLVDKIKRLISSNLLYNIFSFILIPKKKYKKSRDIFRKEAKKLEEKEFFLWLTLITTFPKIYTYNRLSSIKTNKLYLMGEDDIMFINVLKKYIQKDNNAKLEIIKNAGHVCNIDNIIEVNLILNNYFEDLLK